MTDSKPDYPVIAVKAFDWCGPDSTMEAWTEDELADLSCIEAWIVGLLVHENEDRVVICQQYFPDTGNHRAPIAVSKATIRVRIDY